MSWLTNTDPRDGHHILVVDDDADIRDSIKEILELEGYAVRTAEHGAAALKAIKEKGAPCLILLDLMMPVMNGREFLDALRRECGPPVAEVPVTIVSALDEAEQLRAQYRCDVLRKPVDIDDMLRTARMHCAVC